MQGKGCIPLRVAQMSQGRGMSASGKMSLRLHPDKCSEEVADFCGGREKVGVM